MTTGEPTRFAGVILCFAELFRQRTWRLAEQLLIGAILVPGVRTVASVLRVLGLSGGIYSPPALTAGIRRPLA